jgi:hypothetical protein
VSNRLVISDGVEAKEVQAYKVSHESLVKPIQRALVAENGVLRQYWPPAGDGTDSRVKFDTAEITSTQRTISPTDCQAEISFVRGSGTYFYNDHPNGNKIGIYLAPALDGTGGDDGKYLIRLDPVSGSFIGDAVSTWIDINSGTEHRWFIEQSGIGIANGEADITVATDDGGGAPLFGTEVTKRVKFIAEVAAENDIGWTASPWNIEEIKEGIDADCKLTYYPDGTVVGDGDTSGTFNENWHRLATMPGDVSGWTVQVDLVSGTAPSGPALATPHALDVEREWVLTATTGEDLSCELDVTVSDGVDTSVKRVTKHSQRNDLDNEITLTTGTQVISVTGDGTFATGALVTRTNGVLAGVSDTGVVNDDWTENWHTNAPAATDSNLYECKLVADMGSDLPTGGNALDVFINCALEVAWFWTMPAAPPSGILQFEGDYTIQLVGQPSTAVTKHIIVQVSVVPGEGP